MVASTVVWLGACGGSGDDASISEPPGAAGGSVLRFAVADGPVVPSSGRQVFFLALRDGSISASASLALGDIAVAELGPVGADVVVAAYVPDDPMWEPARPPGAGFYATLPPSSRGRELSFVVTGMARSDTLPKDRTGALHAFGTPPPAGTIRFDVRDDATGAAATAGLGATATQIFDIGAAAIPFPVGHQIIRIGAPGLDARQIEVDVASGKETAVEVRLKGAPGTPPGRVKLVNASDGSPVATAIVKTIPGDKVLPVDALGEVEIPWDASGVSIGANGFGSLFYGPVVHLPGAGATPTKVPVSPLDARFYGTWIAVDIQATPDDTWKPIAAGTQATQEFHEDGTAKVPERPTLWRMKPQQKNPTLLNPVYRREKVTPDLGSWGLMYWLDEYRFDGTKLIYRAAGNPASAIRLEKGMPASPSCGDGRFVITTADGKPVETPAMDDKVLDKKTGLLWKRSHEDSAAEPYCMINTDFTMGPVHCRAGMNSPNIIANWEGAKAYCAGMGARVPTSDELLEILGPGKIVSCAFDNEAGWSSTPASAGNAYRVNQSGTLQEAAVTKDMHFRCVKGP